MNNQSFKDQNMSYPANYIFICLCFLFINSLYKILYIQSLINIFFYQNYLSFPQKFIQSTHIIQILNKYVSNILILLNICDFLIHIIQKYPPFLSNKTLNFLLFNILDKKHKQMYKQISQICRKKDAFRSKIRRDHIDNIFKQRRQQILKQMKQQRQAKQHLKHIKQIQQHQIPSNHSNTYMLQYPFKSSSIPQIPIIYSSMQRMISESNQDDNDRNISKNLGKLSQFGCFQQFAEYIDKMVQVLPKSVYALVRLFNDNPKLVRQFMRYLFLPNTRNTDNDRGRDDHSGNKQHDRQQPYDDNYQSPTKTRGRVQQFPIHYISPPPKSIFSVISSSQIYQKYPNLPKYTQKFNQSSVSQWLNYIHILQSLLITQLQPSHLSSFSSSSSSYHHSLIIQQTCSKIVQHSFQLSTKNKIMYNDIIKACFDYLITIHDNIVRLNNLQIIMIADHIRQIFTKYYSQNQQYRNHDLFDSGILVCNNIISLKRINANTTNNNIRLRQEQIDIDHKIQQTKTIFINQLLTTPATLHNICNLAISSQQSQQLQHILLLYINLTYVLDQPQKIYLFISSLLMLIMCILGQKQKIVYRYPIISISVLRIVNNIAVSDRLCCEAMWRDLLISRIIEVYGNWCIKGDIQERDRDREQEYEMVRRRIEEDMHAQGEETQQNNNNSDKRDINSNMQYQMPPPPHPTNIYPQPQLHIFGQFISTISTYIILLNSSLNQSSIQNQSSSNSSKQNKNKIITYNQNFKHNLYELIHTKYIHQIICYGLEHTCNTNSSGEQWEIIPKCLQALIVLSNFQGNYVNPKRNYHGNDVNVVNRYLVRQKQLFINVIQKVVQTKTNIIGLAQSILAIIKEEEDRQEEIQIREEKERREKILFQEHFQNFKNKQQNQRNS